MSDQDNSQDQVSQEDESLTTQDMEDVSGGACMVFVDSAGCSNTTSGGSGGSTTGGSGSGSTSVPGGRGH